MARKARKLRVSFSQNAQDKLIEIGEWTAERFGVRQAEAYLAFLSKEAKGLSLSYASGRSLPARENLKYVALRWRRSASGHLLIYRVLDDTVEIVDIYHTAQNWKGDTET